MASVEPDGVAASLYVVDWMATLVVVSSVALFLYSRRGNRHAAFMLDLGLAYLILTALAIAVINWNPVPAHTSVAPMISPIGPIMLMFAAIVPNTRTRTLVAGLIAASMNPISMLIARERDIKPPNFISDVSDCSTISSRWLTSAS